MSQSYWHGQHCCLRQAPRFNSGTVGSNCRIMIMVPHHNKACLSHGSSEWPHVYSLQQPSQPTSHVYCAYYGTWCCLTGTLHQCRPAGQPHQVSHSVIRYDCNCGQAATMPVVRGPLSIPVALYYIVHEQLWPAACSLRFSKPAQCAHVSQLLLSYMPNFVRSSNTG